MAGALISGLFGGIGGGWKGAALGILGSLGPRAVVEGPRLSDRSVQVAELGFPIPTIYGRHRTAGAVKWAPTEGLREIRDEQNGNGKDRTKYIRYRYELSCAVLICGPSKRIWTASYNDFMVYQWDGTTERIHESLAKGSTVYRDPRTGDEIIVAPDEPVPIAAAWGGWRAETVPAQTVYDPVTGTYTAPEFRIYTGTETQMPDSIIETDIGVGKTSAMRGQTVWVVGGATSGFVIEPPVGTWSFEVEGLYSDLGDVCLDIWEKCGVPASLVDVSRVGGENVDGFILESRSQGREALQELARNHRFDWCHRNGREVAIPRGGDIVVSIPRGDTRCRELQAPSAGIDNPPHTEISDADIILLPVREEFEYHDRARQYHPNMRAAWTEAPPYNNLQNKAASSSSEVMDGSHAQAVADYSLHSAREEALKIQFAVGNEYRYLQPTDPIEFPLGPNNLLARFRIISMQRQQPGGLLSGLAVRDSADMANAPLGEDTEGLPPVVVEVAGGVTLFLTNLNASTDSHCNGTRGASYPTPIVYAFASGHKTLRLDTLAFYGTEDDGQHAAWEGNATMGYTVGTLADFEPGAAIVDEETELIIDYIQGSPSSATDEALVANERLNQLFVGREILQFRDATFLGIFDDKKRYRHTHLHRGQRGTEWAISEHEDEEPAGLMSTSLVLDFDTEYMGREVQIGFATNAGNTTSAILMIPEGTNLKPHSPAYVELVDVAIDGTITARWKPRTRFVGAAKRAWETGVQPPLGETSERYEVDILNSLGGVVDTVTGLTSPELVYSAARMIEQFGSVQTTLRVRVFQLSTSVGRGYGTYKELVT